MISSDESREIWQPSSVKSWGEVEVKALWRRRGGSLIRQSQVNTRMHQETSIPLSHSRSHLAGRDLGGDEGINASLQQIVEAPRSLIG